MTYDSSVYALQPSPTRQLAWIIQYTYAGEFHSIRTDAFTFRDAGEFLQFWRMVTADAVHPKRELEP